MKHDTAVRIETLVSAPIDHAFTVFVERIGWWWPRTHSVTGDLADVILEPRPGGRLYERSADGTECDWGTVLAVEPPHHVALSWAFTPEWQPSADPSHASRVDIRFTSTGPGTTSVVLEHTELERHGEGWTAMRDSIAGDGGWVGILADYARAAVA
jgi:uncharacterized protein YndB with AHSA1/START domain